MRKSSRGNPYHDEKGRFASADSHKITSELKDYTERTKERQIEQEVLEGLKNGIMPFYADDESTAIKHRILKRKLGDNKIEAKQRANEIFSLNGKTYSNAKKKVDGNGNIMYEATEFNGYTRIFSAEEYEKRKSVNFSQPNAKEFYDNFMLARNSQEDEKKWRVATDYTANDYKHHKRFVADDGATFSIHDGDIVSVCTVKGGTTKGKTLLAKAVAEGGNRLDAYSGIFGFYTSCGFEPVSICEWQDDFAPDDWVKANKFTDNSWKKEKSDKEFPCKREYIVFFKYTGKNSSEKFEDCLNRIGYYKGIDGYEQAQNKRDKEIGIK